MVTSSTSHVVPVAVATAVVVPAVVVISSVIRTTKIATAVVAKVVEIVRRWRTRAEVIVEATRGTGRWWSVEVEVARWSRVEIRRRTGIEVWWHARRWPYVGIEVVRIEIVGPRSKVIGTLPKRVWWTLSERVRTRGTEIVWPVLEVVRSWTETVRPRIEVCGREIVGPTEVRGTLIEVEIFLLATETEFVSAVGVLAIVTA